MEPSFTKTSGSSRVRFKTEYPVAMIAALCACLMSGCSSAKVTGERSIGDESASKPAVIYVEDFELAARDIKQENGIVLRPSGKPGPVRRLLSGSKDPQKLARQLVDLMATSIVKDLTKAGFTAFRQLPDSPLPAQGWLVKGIFTEVQEGNRLRRTIIGFGAGATDMQAVTSISDLSKGPPKPFYEIDTSAKSGEKPGAIPTMILISPYSAAVHFVISGRDLDRNVKETAKKISAHIVQQVQELN